MNIAPSDLAAQSQRAALRWPFFRQVEVAHHLPLFLLTAVGSRETDLDPAYTEGAVGDGGHGHGLFQLDDRWHDIPEGFDTDPRLQAETAAAQLELLYRTEGDWVRALNRYNSGQGSTEGTTGHDYGPDVWERRAYLLAQLPPVDRRPPSDPDSAGPRPKAPEFKIPAATTAAQFLVGERAPTAQAVLRWFIDHDGLSEQPDGSNHVPGVTDRCGLGNVAWCAESASIALMAGGFGDLDAFTMQMPDVWTRYGWGWAYCPDIVQAFQDAGRWHLSAPEPGDVVLFDWDGDNWADHVGVVEQDLGDGTVLTREGNADNRVTQKRRSVQDILGYGRPPYATEQEDVLVAVTQEQWDDLAGKVGFIAEYIQNDRKAAGGLDDKERFVAQVVTEEISAVDQAGDGDRGLGWRRRIATWRGTKRPVA